MSQATGHSNLHATALTIGDRGVLIRGPSGSGKTTLALALISAARAAGRQARLVSDDQVLAFSRNGRLVCTAPLAIAGLVEIRGSTPAEVAHEPSALMDLVVDLVDAAAAPRFSETQRDTIAGCRLPLLVTAARNLHAAVPAVFAHFRMPPFG